MAARAVVSHAAVVLALAALAAPCRAQQPVPPPQLPPVRPLGPIMQVSNDSLESVAAAVEVAGGRVYVNDITARRLLLFDSTLQSDTIVLDSAEEGATSYGTLPGTLLPYRGDSALFIAPRALSMLVLSPAGAIARVMAVPPSNGGLPALIGNIFGTPGFDAGGRLVYYSPARMTIAPPSPSGELPRLEPPDSAFVVRFDFATRTLDTVAAIRIPRTHATISRDDQGRFHMSMTAYPPRTVDDWGVTSDGAIAVVRGLDYHIDWVNPDGTHTSTPRIPYAWEHLSDEEKTALVDSTAKAMQVMMDSLPARMQRAGFGGPAPATGGGGRGATARGGGPGGGGAVIVVAPTGPGGPGGSGRSGPASATIVPTVTPAEVADVPDYRPPFGQGAVRADLSDNLWIRTNKWVEGRPVYDIVGRSGELKDRVQLPPHRTIAGFGPGVVYMAVQDSSGVVHLERAGIK
jgi:hypothetical protein